ncbi:hypothetical protein Trydic_g1275 [Trypoxylus dichotomus]
MVRRGPEAQKTKRGPETGIRTPKPDTMSKEEKRAGNIKNEIPSGGRNEDTSGNMRSNTRLTPQSTPNSYIMKTMQEDPKEGIQTLSSIFRD